MFNKKYIKNIFYILVCLLTFGCLLTGTSHSYQKRILGLYKSSDNATKKDNAIVNYLKVPLNRLGYRVDCRDALKPLPSSNFMKRYDAIITFYFNPSHPTPRKYISWLKKQIEQKRKVIIIGNFGAHTKDEKSWLKNEDLNEFFFPFGLSFKGTIEANEGQLEVIYKNLSMIKRLPKKLPNYFTIFKPINSKNINYLILKIKDKINTKSTLIVKTPYGAMAQIGYLYNYKNGNLVWNLNLSKFLNQALLERIEKKPTTKKILGLYKSTENKNAKNNYIRRFASEHLISLGYSIDYIDVEKNLPSKDIMNQYDAIVTWYTTAIMNNADEYCLWLGDQIMAGKKVIVLGNFGAYGERIKEGKKTYTRFLDTYEVNNFFYPFGLKMQGFWTGDPNKINLRYLNPDIINARYLKDPKSLNNFYSFKSVLEQNKGYLILNRKDITNSKSFVVTSTPYGGMALQGYIFRQEPKTWKFNYILKLRPFFKDCLKDKGFIPPETFLMSTDMKEEIKRAKAMKKDKIPPPCLNPLKRKILVIYKGTEIENFELDSFYLYSGPVLNFLGLTVEYRDIEKDLPDNEYMEPYLGIVSWFSNNSMKNAFKFNNWLLKQIKNHKKIVILGTYGAIYEAETYKFAHNTPEVFKSLQLEMGDEYLFINKGLRTLANELITSRNFPSNYAFEYDFEEGRPDEYDVYYASRFLSMVKSYFGFEAKPKFNKDTDIFPVKSIGKDNKAILNYFSYDGGDVSPAVMGPWGGVLLGDFFYKEPEDKGVDSVKTYKKLINLRYDTKLTEEKNNGKWIINPFKFFNKALGIQDMPRLDYTTINGQRIFYSHIDGDGLTNVSKIYPMEYAGRVILEKLLKKYNLPISASIISEDIEKSAKKYYNSPLKLAREIFALDNIEIATHTHTHPFDLESGDLEVQLKNNKDKYKISHKRPNPKREILYSTALINQNAAPEDKKVKIVFWPGKCNPTEQFIAMADRLDLANINGGDPIYDDQHKSYSNICPIFTKKGTKLQIHTSGSNDYIYTQFWTGNYGGMKNLIKHIKDTETPIRICPINVYYHYYSGVYKKSLNALIFLYNYVLKNHVACIFASQYSKIIKDFYYSKIGKRDDGSFEIHNMGYLRTVRFDNKKAPDLSLCKNVIGFDYINNSLYVFLDENKTHTIHLFDGVPNKTYLKSASHYVNRWKANPQEVTALLEGIGPGFMQIANLSSNTLYSIKLGNMNLSKRTDKDGLLQFNYEFFGKPKSYNLKVQVQK